MIQTTLLLAAANEKIDAGKANIPTISEDQLLTNILNTTYFVGGTVAVIVIIIAGIMYVASSGDPSRIKIAKNALTYALVGLIVLISAFIVTNFIIGRFV